MNGLKAPSLQSLLESDRGSTDSLLAESLQLDFEDLDDVEYSIPQLDSLPTLESVLSEFDGDSDVTSENNYTIPTPTPSMTDDASKGGSILRHVIFQGISSQISSAADRINAGTATALDISLMIAVGTSHGHILNFDSTQTLKWAHQDNNSQGSVSALSFNEDCSRLLAGFARGLVIMIDTRSGNVLRNLYDAITPNTGVLNLKWTGRSALALCADSGGSVWSLSFTRKLGIRGCASRCLFSGARGEVCCIEPLILEEENHNLRQFLIVALATLSKYFVVTIRPRLKVVKFHALTGPAGCLPLLNWQMVLIQAANSLRTIDPVLVAARGNQIFFHQISVSNGRVNLIFLRHVELNYELLNVHWLGPKSIVCVDTSEILHLVDVRSNRELECVDMANAGLVYGSSQFKGLATGGNVSPALALAGSRACYSSISSRGTQLYILGARSLHIISIRNWSERITYLVHNQRWVEACELAIEGYKTASDRPRKKQEAKDRIIELFNDYLSVSNRTAEFCLGPIVKCLIEINELNLLWQDLWDRLNSPNLFLTIITEHIENDDINHVSPIIAQALVDFWVDLSSEKLEEIILKLDWTCLDLNQVLKCAKQKKLYKAQIYLNTKALQDYVISLTDFIPLIETEHPDLGNSLLVYISSCLAGRGYPNGNIPTDQVQHVKHEVLRCLTSLHSNGGEENELPYPYLRALLKFNTRETLNVISLAFQEKEFTGELGVSHRKRIINIFLEIMSPENTTWSQIGCLLNFISQQISVKYLPDDAQLLEKVIDHLAKEYIEGETPRQHSDREHAWLELIASNCLTHIPLKEQLQMAERAKCFAVVEYLLEKLKQYDKILNCYLQNSQRHIEMFLYIDIHANNSERKIYPQIYEYFTQLLEIDAERITKLIVDNYNDNIEALIDKLSNDTASKLLLEFLNNLLKFSIILSEKNSEKYIELLSKNKDNFKVILEFLKNSDSYGIENSLEIIKNNMHDNFKPCVIYLYEKQGNYELAFQLSMDILIGIPENSDYIKAETNAMHTSSLLLRASQILSDEVCEKCWFDFLKIILSRSDLALITKNCLHLASQHVDLTKLVQLIMNSCATHSNNFGDIKDLLISMLSNSRYETILMETTARCLGKDLNLKFAKKRNESKRGIWITLVKCIICRQRLHNQTNVIVLASCGHSIHEKCAENYFLQNASTASSEDRNGFDCPRCGTHLINPIDEPFLLTSQVHSNKIDEGNFKNNSHSLQLKAPIRKF